MIVPTIFVFSLFSYVSGKNDHDSDLMHLQTAFTFSDPLTNETDDLCVWKTLQSVYECPDSGINFYYYSRRNSNVKVGINPLESNALQETDWDPQKDNIIYIHGYGGGDEMFPTFVLRHAYLTNGSYNVFIVDWGPLCKMPCYVSSIHNLKAVAQCTAELFKNIRAQGVPSDRISCVGHSLGAHGCGLISRFLEFRMHRIIGLDPAGPMITNQNRLKSGMANNVQVIYTNAGVFGDFISNGRVNFCINGGKTQPTCRNAPVGVNVCSHVQSVCFMAESISGAVIRRAVPCMRNCPFGRRKSPIGGLSVLMGQHTPDMVSGSYCFNTGDIPYCSKTINQYGHPSCCVANSETEKFENEY